jgi:hypothetical protein
MPTSSVTLSSGDVVKVRPISVRLLEQYDRAHVEPVPPMRNAEAIGGVIEQLPDYDDPDYKQRKRAYDERATSDMMEMLIEFGMDVELPADDSWVRKLAKVGIEVDNDNLKSTYIQCILMTDFLVDIKVIVKEILTLSGVTEEAISSWANMF